jgi:hypothetical protein
VLLVLFTVGICAGVIISERLYISSNREDILRGTALPNKPRSARSAGPLAGNAAAGATSAAQLAGNAAAAAVVYQKDAQMQALEQYLLKVAPNREVLVGVSNVNPLREGMLETFLQGIKQAGVSNYLVVALDEETERELKFRNINVFHMPMQVRQPSCIAHFGAEYRELWSVLALEVKGHWLESSLSELHKFAGRLVGCSTAHLQLQLTLCGWMRHVHAR